MKKIYREIALLPAALLATMLVIISCTKDDDDGSPGIKPGNPVATIIMPDSSAGGGLLTLQGSGLGDMRSIVFGTNNVPAPFTSTLNTETAIIFRVPDTAYGGVQNIIFTNSAGKTLLVPFRVLAYPSIASVSNYNFSAGTQVTLTGNNLSDVTTVTLSGTSDAATIVSQTQKTLTIAFPSTTVNRATLDITNATGKMTTTQEFINIDAAYQIFTDNYSNGFGDGSWGSAGFITTDEHKSGTSSVAKTYQKGNWHLINFANWWPGTPSDPSYKYLTFWIRGAAADHTLYLTGDKRAGGFGNSDQTVPLNVPANTWTYFKLPLADIGLWATGTPFNQLGFWIKGPDNQDETFYFDDVLLVK